MLLRLYCMEFGVWWEVTILLLGAQSGAVTLGLHNVSMGITCQSNIHNIASTQGFLDPCIILFVSCSTPVLFDLYIMII